MKISIPYKARLILNKLKKHGFSAYVVGGCVRDSILGKKPNDWDITTNAKPNDIISIFKHTVPTGLKHGTVTVLIDNTPFEVTTFRVESKYENNRKPIEVFFVNDIENDLARRDFTVNALAYNDIDGLIDYFNGVEHINNKLIKAVGNANERFNEDALRMLRAIRFSCQLNFHIEYETLKAIKSNSKLIQNISNERIKDELNKILISSRPKKGIILLNNTNILKLILPQIKDFNFSKELLGRCLIRDSLILKLCCLLISVEDVTTTLSRLRYDNKTNVRVSSLLKYKNISINNIDELSLKYMLRDLGVDDFFILIKLKELMGYNKNDIFNLNTMAKNIINKNEPLTLKELNINGKDILSLGVKHGSDVGRILNLLLDHVLVNPSDNDKSILLSIAKENL